MQGLLHPQELLLLALQHPSYRYAGPFGHYLGDVFRGNCFRYKRFLDLSHLCVKFGYGLADLFHPAVTYFGDLAVVSGPFGGLSLDLVVLHLLARGLKGGKGIFLLLPLLHQHIPSGIEVPEFRLYLLGFERRALPAYGLLLDLELAYPAVQFVYRLRHGVHLQPQLRSGLVHQVYGLVRKETVGDVPVRKIHSRNQRVILYPHLVVILVLLLQPPQYGYGGGRRRLVHGYGLEPPLQGLVGLEVFLVLVQGGGTYGPEFTPCQRRLQYVGRIHRA